MAKILVVEDDQVMGLAVKTALESRKHTVELVGDGLDAIGRLEMFGYDIVVLDWAVPGISGIEVLKKYRQRKGHASILMLTGKGHIEDKQEGFETGADDYLTKPFDLRELIARVDALLRRGRTFQDEILRFKNVELNVKSRVAYIDGVDIALSSTEFSLLEFLMRRPSRYFTVNDLLDQVWSGESEVSEHAVRQCISRLRGKLESTGCESILKTAKGLGYRVGE